MIGCCAFLCWKVHFLTGNDAIATVDVPPQLKVTMVTFNRNLRGEGVKHNVQTPDLNRSVMQSLWETLRGPDREAVV